MSTLTNAQTLYTNMDTLLAKWAGVENIAATATTNGISSREIAILQKFLDSTLNSSSANASNINTLYSEIKNEIYTNFIAQTNLGAQLGLTYNYETNTASDNNLALLIPYLNKNNSNTQSAFIANIAMQELNMNTFTNYSSKVIVSGDGDTTTNSDLICDFGSNDTIFGNNGNDVISGASNDLIYAGKGNNTIYGGTNDTIISAEGNNTFYTASGDTINASYNNDTYIFNKGTGLVSINDSGGSDTIQFGAGIAKTDLSVKVSGNDMIISIAGTTDKLTLKNQFGAVLASNTIENYTFADGTTLKSTDLSNMVVIDDRTGGNKTITGTGTNDSIYGGINDIINTGNGNNIITPMSGDTVNGGTGNDTYIFNKGTGSVTVSDTGGTDTIQFGTGITKSNLSVTASGNDLIISLTGTTDKLTLKNQFYNFYNTFPDAIENFTFTDGTSLTSTALGNMIVIDDRTGGNKTLTGTGTNDSIYGGINDIINTGNGNNIITPMSCDTINGGTGNDTYIFNKGTGSVTVSDTGGTDTIQFGTGITKSNLSVIASGNDMVLSFTGTTDKLTLKNQFYNYYNTFPDAIENFTFTDGTSLTSTTLANMIVIDDRAAGNKTITGTGTNDSIYGGINDIINTGNGNNSITPMSGDTINGGTGNDTYIFNKGTGAITINDAGGTDTIQFGAGITKSNLSITASGNDMIISLTGTTDKLTIKNQVYNYFNTYPDAIENFTFTDGSSLGYLDVQKMISGGSTAGTLVSGNTLYTGTTNNDIYLFNKGAGQDTINDGGGTDTIQFGAGITQSNLSITASGNDLILGITGTSDKLTLKNQFNSTTYANLIENYKFSDGTSISYYNLQNMVTIDGTAGNMTINGTGTNDTIYGGTKDTINGGNGNDTIYAASGDIINGGTGNDTYMFNKGAGAVTINDAGGTDKIQFGAGITQSNLSITAAGNDMVISIAGTSDKLTLKNQFNSTTYANLIENYKFSDGTSISYYNLQNMVTIDGTAGNIAINGTGTNDTIYGGTKDTINGGNGNDTIYAASGDIINGGTGNDIYMLNKGAGAVTINDAGGTDKIQFGTTVTKNNIALFEDSKGNIYIDYGATTNTDRTTVSNWNNTANQIEKIQAGDNTYISNVDINKIIQNMTAFATGHGISITSVDNVKTNTALMNIINTAWHN